MDILLIGSGVIGSVYGAQLALGGQRVWVYEYTDHDRLISRNGIQIRDLSTDQIATASVRLATNPFERTFDVVLVAVRSDQLASTFSTLRKLTSSPHIIFLGNNPNGKQVIPKDLSGNFELGFPGIGGNLTDGVAEYLRIPQQPTTLERPASQISLQIEAILRTRGFQIQRTKDIDGWLAYHAVFVSSIAMALLRVNSDARALSNDKPLLALMCRSIEEGFAALRSEGHEGLPRNLAILHNPLLRPIAIHYWAKTMRSPMGEVCFAAHTRHAPNEMRELAAWAYRHAAKSRVSHEGLDQLVAEAAHPKSLE